MILAAFGTEADMMGAVAALRAAHLADVETYSPVPPPENLEAETEGSRLPLVILGIGLFAAAGLFFLQAYGETIGYPFIVGGRPNFSWPTYLPATAAFALMVAMGAGVFGFFAANRLPRLYEPVDEVTAFRNAMRAGFFVAVHDKEDQELARAVLEGLRPELIEEVEEEEEE